MATSREPSLSSLSFEDDFRRRDFTKDEGRAVQIVEFKDNNEPVVNLRAFEQIVQSDIPTLVVSISGVARSGKSFLLNLLVNLLTYLENVCFYLYLHNFFRDKKLPISR